MIPKSNRLARREIEALFAKKPNGISTSSTRRQFHTDSFFVITEPSESFKVGVSVPKKVLARAVDRNATRRLVLDAMRERGFLTRPFHMHLSLKKGTKNLSRESIAREIDELYKKVDVSDNQVSP